MAEPVKIPFVTAEFRAFFERPHIAFIGRDWARAFEEVFTALSDFNLLLTDVEIINTGKPVDHKAIPEMSPSGESLLANYQGGLSSRNAIQQISISLRSYESVSAYEDYILSYEYRILQTRKDHREELCALHQDYVILDDSATLVELFEAEPALYHLLIDAVAPLHRAFGDMAILHMQILSSDEDSILKVAVQLPATFEGDPDRALQSFDNAWWVHHCHRSGGVLVFDYEMPHAI